MRKNKILFNNKKGLDVAGKIVAFFIVITLGYLILNIFIGNKAIAETSINQQILKAQFKKCKMEYLDAKERGEVSEKIDVDKDGCHDALDICIVDNSEGDKDLDGIPDKCDILYDNYANTKDNKRYSQRLLCKGYEDNYWDKDKEICCSKLFVNDKLKKAPICKNAKR